MRLYAEYGLLATGFNPREALRDAGHRSVVIYASPARLHALTGRPERLVLVTDDGDVVAGLTDILAWAGAA